MSPTLSSAIDSPDMRRAGRDLLSLALMDARNHTLHLSGRYEEALAGAATPLSRPPEVKPPLWELGHIGWFQERWLGRNLQRQLGRFCDPSAARLASIEPQADRWWDPERATQGCALDLPGLAPTKSYLLDTLESTLELLDKATEDDEALYFYRLALFHEDRHGEHLICLAQSLGLPVGLHTPGPQPMHEPLLLPATFWQLGSAEVGFSFDNERAQHDVAVPEFEIDAQVVSWAQFAEFVDDAGYERAELWQAPGWRWLQTKVTGGGRRAPRYVDQIGAASGAVLQNSFGSPRRLLAGQPVMHVSWWEADAWCRWAGRRLPAEVEWEVAAQSAARRGFHWGEVWEWTGSSLRPYPGFVADPDRAYSEPCFGTHKVLRGASFATRARMKHPKYRCFCRPERDDVFAGFRSCAL